MERDRELAAVERALEAARAGTGGCLAIDGGAGLGKSSLLRAACERARELGMTVCRGSGDELERDFPFGVALQLFEPTLGESLFEGAAALAAPLFEREPLADGQSFSLIHGLHWLAANLAERAPLLITVDDAHWCDPQTLRFIRYLLQRLDELRIALVVSRRPDAGGEPGRLTARIAGHPLTTVVELAPLSEAAVAELVRAELSPDADDETCRACAAATGGNPFYLRQLIDSGDTTARMPSIVARVEALDEPAGSLAVAAAMLGDGTPLDLAAALAGLDVRRAAVAADALAGAAVLEPGLPLRFRHAILREAIYESVPPALRSAEHAAAARLLLDRGADPERAAAHLLMCDAAGASWAVATLMDAARRSRRRGSLDAAARYLRAAHGDGSSAPPTLVADLAHAEAVIGAADAPERARAALAALPAGGERAETALRLALALVEGGFHDAAGEACDVGVAALGGEGGGSGDAGAADRELAATLRAVRAAVSGLDAATAAPGGLDAVLRRTAGGVATPSERLMLAHGALAKAFAGADRDEVTRLARGSLEGGSPDCASATEMSALSLATAALIVADELPIALTALEAAIASARARGSVIAFATASHLRGHVFFRQGRLEEAIADAQTALDASRYGWEPALPAVHALLANALLERGEREAALAALALPGGEERWADTFTFTDYLEARAGTALAGDDPEAALADALACGDRLEAIGVAHPAVVPWRSVAARAAAALGDPERAARLAHADVERARAFGAPWALGRALRTAGELAGADRGLELLREAVEVVPAARAPLERAHALAALGSALLAESHRLAAREALREALDLAHRCGATALEARARDGLVATGARPRRPQASGRDALTPRELRIARMAAGGMSNREIAEALFITRKTVETHLGRAYRKLGVTSREDLPGALGSSS